jgi:hypothetical protein
MGRLTLLNAGFFIGLIIARLNKMVCMCKYIVYTTMTARQDLENFGIKKIHEIKLWAWAAAVLPCVSLVVMILIWHFGTSDLFSISIITVVSTMISVAVVWWWWAIHAIYRLIILWHRADKTLEEVKFDIKDIKVSVKEIFFSEHK